MENNPVRTITYLDPDVHPGDYIYKVVPFPMPKIDPPLGHKWQLQPNINKDDNPYKLVWIAIPID